MNHLTQEAKKADRALAETTALLVLKKNCPPILWGARGRLVALEERTQAIKLIIEACCTGASKRKTCESLGITVRTVERWEKDNGLIDKRKQVIHLPANKLRLNFTKVET
jgi:hypothetical protein